MSERTNNIGDELLALKDSAGKINPTDAVKWAREHTKSHLHAELEWDDSVAGERYRVWQVRSLISVHIVDANGGRQFVSLSIDRRDGGYRPVADVMANTSLRAIMLSDALADLDRIRNKYQNLQELEKVWAARDVVAQQAEPEVRSSPPPVRRKAAERRPLT